MSTQRNLFEYGLKNPRFSKAHIGYFNTALSREIPKMELELKEGVKLNDGRHNGLILRVEYVHSPYEYTEVYIRPENADFELRYGCPSVLSQNSKLYKLISQFKKIDIGQKADPEKILVGKNVSFLTQMKDTPKGTFVTIVDDSIKPL